MAEFSERGFSIEEMVILLAGGHTIGKAKCFFIEVDAAPIDPTYRSNITSFCDGKDGEKGAIPMDPITPDIVDSNYFGLVMAKKMPLTIDRLLGLDPRTAPIVQAMETKLADFGPLFSKAMEKLSVMKVITGKDGEIRKSCSEFNNPVTTDDGPSVIRISSLNPEEMMGSLPPATGRASSESRKMAAGGAMEERMAAGMKPPGAEEASNAFLGKVANNEATKSVPLMSVDENQAAGGADPSNVAGAANEAAAKAKAMGGQSFSMAGAGDKGIGGEAEKKAKAMGGQSFSMAGAGEAAMKMKSQSFSMAGAGQEANKGVGGEETNKKGKKKKATDNEENINAPGGEEAQKRHQPKLRGGQQQ
ncbi:hypothetical protein E2562_034339 [Oryza meyeriana var. granulata]|uniref:Peroxidase n=1 Tax=Oryza meyeriana var. granulata TaxID=110450 RepID=A0A6G1BQ87_9ORYZ|nr:hypothetical protein E2562_034339 [Oryza meyeriana var. granulata]